MERKRSRKSIPLRVLQKEWRLYGGERRARRGAEGNHGLTAHSQGWHYSDPRSLELAQRSRLRFPPPPAGPWSSPASPDPSYKVSVRKKGDFFFHTRDALWRQQTHQSACTCGHLTAVTQGPSTFSTVDSSSEGHERRWHNFSLKHQCGTLKCSMEILGSLFNNWAIFLGGDHLFYKL